MEGEQSRWLLTWCHVCQAARRAPIPSRIPPMRMSHCRRAGGSERRRETLVLQTSWVLDRAGPRERQSLKTADAPDPVRAGPVIDIPRGDFRWAGGRILHDNIQIHAPDKRMPRSHSSNRISGRECLSVTAVTVWQIGIGSHWRKVSHSSHGMDLDHIYDLLHGWV